MEEALCHIEIVQEKDRLIARVQTDLGGIREFEGSTYEDILGQLVFDLQEEFDTTLST